MGVVVVVPGEFSREYGAVVLVVILVVVVVVVGK